MGFFSVGTWMTLSQLGDFCHLLSPISPRWIPIRLLETSFEPATNRPSQELAIPGKRRIYPSFHEQKAFAGYLEDHKKKKVVPLLPLRVGGYLEDQFPVQGSLCQVRRVQLTTVNPTACFCCNVPAPQPCHVQMLGAY